MVQSTIDIGEREDRVVAIVKGKFGLKNKSQAINYIIDTFEKELLEPELRPEFAKKLERLETRGKFKKYNTLSELKRKIEKS